MSGTVSHFTTEHGTSLETPYRARASSCEDVETTWFFSSCGRILEFRRGFQASSWVALGSPISHSSSEGNLGVALESLQGQRDLIKACVRELIFLSREVRDLGVAFQAPSGSQASSRGEAKDSALLSSGDADLLEPTEWPQGSPAYSSVWREDPGFLSRPCRNRRPSAREDGGVSGVSSSCGARGGFLLRHDKDLREPLVRRQGSQVSMHVARGSASWHSSHWRGLGPRDALKKDSRFLSRGAAGNPRFPRLLPGTLGNFPRCL